MRQIFMSFAHNDQNYTIERPSRGKQFVKQHRQDQAIYKIKGNIQELAEYHQVIRTVQHGAVSATKGYFIQAHSGKKIDLVLIDFFNAILDTMRGDDIAALAKSLDQSTFPDKVEMIKAIYNRLEDGGERQRNFIDGLDMITCSKLLNYMVTDNGSDTDSNFEDAGSERSLSFQEKIALRAESDSAYIVDLKRPLSASHIPKKLGMVSLDIVLVNVAENREQRRRQFLELAQELIATFPEEPCAIQCLLEHATELGAVLTWLEAGNLAIHVQRPAEANMAQPVDQHESAAPVLPQFDTSSARAESVLRNTTQERPAHRRKLKTTV